MLLFRVWRSCEFIPHGDYMLSFLKTNCLRSLTLLKPSVIE